MNHLRFAGIFRLCVGSMFAASLLMSCSDDYTYDDENPNFLGAASTSIFRATAISPITCALSTT